MAKKKVREQATIQATTPKDFDQLVNEAMAQAAGRGLSVVAIDRRVEDGFVAFIDLEGDVEVCESVMEEYESKQERGDSREQAIDRIEMIAGKKVIRLTEGDYAKVAMEIRNG